MANLTTKTGILLTNLGTPDAPTPDALRRYLAEFLWDHRVVEMPRWKWWLILNGIILRTRPKKVAKVYQKIWSPEQKEGPLLAISKRQRDAVQQKLVQELGAEIPVELGMRYGNPSIASALEKLRQQKIEKLIVLPLFPQYSAVTTGSTFDAVSNVLQQWRNIPELHFIRDYHDDPGYIAALANSVRESRQQYGAAQKLLLSFHGIPVRYAEVGDPYPQQCQRTAQLLAEELNLQDNEFKVVFQSRFGKEPWIKPYTDETLEQLPKTGIKQIEAICPGFSADCIETLEEIEIGGKEFFLENGGKEFRYIPALNDRNNHIGSLVDLLEKRISIFI